MENKTKKPQETGLPAVLMVNRSELQQGNQHSSNSSNAPFPRRSGERDSKGTRPFGAAPRRGRPPRRRNKRLFSTFAGMYKLVLKACMFKSGAAEGHSLYQGMPFWAGDPARIEFRSCPII